MARIDSRPLRVIAAEDDAHARHADEARRARFDYALLARHARNRRAHDDPASRPSPPAEDAPADDAAAEPAPAELPATPPAQPREAGTRSPSRQALRDDGKIDAQVRDTGAAMVEAVTRSHRAYVTLASTLAREIAGFCADPGVAGMGHWSVRLPLNAAIVPDTVLHVSLSEFRLALRFDTSSCEARQLILHHSAMLESELDALLRAWDTPRDVDITVW